MLISNLLVQQNFDAVYTDPQADFMRVISIAGGFIIGYLLVACMIKYLRDGKRKGGPV